MNLTLEEAIKLYPQAASFSKGDTVPNNDFRKKVEEIFHKSQVRQMTFMASEIYRVLAEEYMKSVKPMPEWDDFGGMPEWLEKDLICSHESGIFCVCRRNWLKNNKYYNSTNTDHADEYLKS